jgi:hypothetical protein
MEFFIVTVTRTSNPTKSITIFTVGKLRAVIWVLIQANNCLWIWCNASRGRGVQKLLKGRGVGGCLVPRYENKRLAAASHRKSDERSVSSGWSLFCSAACDRPIEWLPVEGGVMDLRLLSASYQGDMSVGTAMYPWDGRPFSILGNGRRFFSSPQRPCRFWECTQPPIQWVPRVKRPESKADYSPLFSAVVKNSGAKLPLPIRFITWGLTNF